MATDHYAAVIADLERKRAQIDKLIESLKAFRGVAAPGQTVVEKPGEDRRAPAYVEHGEFTGMNIADAVRIILERADREMTNMEIMDALGAGGLRSDAQQPLNTIGSIINRRAQQTGDIVRVGRGTWATREWSEARRESKMLELSHDPGEQGPEHEPDASDVI